MSLTVDVPKNVLNSRSVLGYERFVGGILLLVSLESGDQVTVSGP